MKKMQTQKKGETHVNNNEVVYILSASKVSFTDDRTGNLVEGTSVWFITTRKKKEVEAEGFGVSPTKHFIRDPLVFESLKKNGTGFYEMEAYVDLFGSKPKLIIEGFNFVSKGNVDFSVKEHAVTK